MTDINLLPWRELKREREKKEFTLYFLVGLISASIFVFFMYSYASTCVATQTRINQRLTDEITRVNTEIKQIKMLKLVRQALLARMTIVKNLQATRPLTVHLFDELIKVMPDGVFLNHLERTGNKIMVLGYAESNTNISQLMRNIEKNKWIENPALTEIKKNQDLKQTDSNAFKLSFILMPKTTGQYHEKQHVK